MRQCLYREYDEYYNSEKHSADNNTHIITSIIEDYENKLKNNYDYEDALKLEFLKQISDDFLNASKLEKIREAIEDLQYRIRRLDDDCDDIRYMTFN
jgi:predicted RecB family endonuclease